MALVESFSGVRGIYGKELTDEIALEYAVAFSEIFKPKIIAIGRDSRKSGEDLRDALIEGLQSHIIDIGMLPTPAIELAVREYKADGGVIITASHNEPEFNGFKFLAKDGGVLSQKNMARLIQEFHHFHAMDESSFLKHTYTNKLTVKHIDIRHEDAKKRYVKFLQRIVNSEFIQRAKVPLLLDPNGGAGIMVREVMAAYGINALYVNMDEGRFKRKVEPDAGSLNYLKKKIPEGGFAAGFDCDADRMEILLHDGTFISGNQILALAVDERLSTLRNPEQEHIVVNDATSYMVKEVVQDYNAKWMEVEVGETNIVEAMVSLNAPIGGEGSNGGVIVPPSRCRDGILTLLFILHTIGRRKKALSELIAELPCYYYLKEKIPLKKEFSSVRDKLMAHYVKMGFTISQTGDDTGGLKAIKDNSWIWFRQSKTEEKILRIIVDAKDESVALKLLKEAKALVR